MTAEYPMQVLSFDSQSEVTSCGRHLRFFNVIDEYMGTALAVLSRRSFKTTDVVAVLEGIIAETGIQPAFARCDNGSEFTADVLVDWCNTVGVSTASIDPGSPWQNGFDESFSAQFWREQVSGEIIVVLVETKRLADDWMDADSQEGAHGSLNGLASSRFWDEWVLENQYAVV